MGSKKVEVLGATCGVYENDELVAIGDWKEMGAFGDPLAPVDKLVYWASSYDEKIPKELEVHLKGVELEVRIHDIPGPSLFVSSLEKTTVTSFDQSGIKRCGSYGREDSDFVIVLATATYEQEQGRGTSYRVYAYTPEPPVEDFVEETEGLSLTFTNDTSRIPTWLVKVR